MAKIKIISNPYQKKTVFQRFDASTAQYIDINQDNNPSSQLLNDKLRSGFFPFKAQQIVDVIIKEYGAGSEKIEIVFEGTEDEYLELKSICDQGDYPDKINLSESGRELENARDILPEVIYVFKELKELIAESVSDKAKIKRELEKFSDASNDVIPICVIGNYSSGKSTFINALIGHELLPSSDEPTTAKIYKISRSKHKDRATIEFKYGDKGVRIRLKPESYEFSPDPDDNPLVVELKKLLDEIAGESIPSKLNKMLDVINDFANREENESISDLIEIEAPFNKDGPLGNMQANFVIFDTPGSNSASNEKHYEVLKKAMEDLSNGLPIFVSEYNTLDSTDNDKLYQDINNMEELDNRFTMIIVNKADGASLPVDDCDHILNWAIPRQLYSGGIYFISSIMGLGFKNDGNFIGGHNEEIFDDQKEKYVNPGNKRYKQLYRYNILPKQLKRKYDDDLLQECKNLLYANSGLYSVEQAIEFFARVYSPYNKCQQSKLFLDKVIEITSREITEAKNKREEYKNHIHDHLEKEKQELIERLEEQSKKSETEYQQNYKAAMKPHIVEATKLCTFAELSAMAKKHLQAQAEEKNVGGHWENVIGSTKSLVTTFGKNLSNVAKEPSLEKFKEIPKGIAEGCEDIAKNAAELIDANKDAKQAASAAVIENIRNDFTAQIGKAQQLLETPSRAYWVAKTDQLKHRLSEIVTNSSELADEKRTELSGIILQYQELSFDARAEAIFDKNSDRLNIGKLTHTYNIEMDQQVSKIFQFFETSHANSFDAWMHNLMAKIIENIDKLSPLIREQTEIIREETARIAELESRMTKLNDYTEQISKMVDWKERTKFFPKNS